MGEKFAGSSGPVRAHGRGDGCLGEEVAVAMAKCLEYGGKCHLGGRSSANDVSRANLSSKAPPTGKVDASSAERFIYGA